MKTAILNGKQVEVIEVKGGWTSYYDQDGKIRKARNSAFAKADKPAKQAKEPKAKRERKAKAEAVTGNVIQGRGRYGKYERPDGSKSLDSADEVAVMLRPLTLDKVYHETARNLRKAGKEEGTIEEIETALRTRYGKLNPGMQRMNLGNRLRGALSAQQ